MIGQSQPSARASRTNSFDNHEGRAAVTGVNTPKFLRASCLRADGGSSYRHRQWLAMCAAATWQDIFTVYRLSQRVTRLSVSTIARIIEAKPEDRWRVQIKERRRETETANDTRESDLRDILRELNN